MRLDLPDLMIAASLRVEIILVHNLAAQCLFSHNHLLTFEAIDQV